MTVGVPGEECFARRGSRSRDGGIPSFDSSCVASQVGAGIRHLRSLNSVLLLERVDLRGSLELKDVFDCGRRAQWFHREEEVRVERGRDGRGEELGEDVGSGVRGVLELLEEDEGGEVCLKIPLRWRRVKGISGVGCGWGVGEQRDGVEAGEDGLGKGPVSLSEPPYRRVLSVVDHGVAKDEENVVLWVKRDASARVLK